MAVEQWNVVVKQSCLREWLQNLPASHPCGPESGTQCKVRLDHFRSQLHVEEVIHNRGAAASVNSSLGPLWV